LFAVLKIIPNTFASCPFFTYEGGHVVSAAEMGLNPAIAMTRMSETTLTVDDLVREHSRLVFKIAYSVLRNHADAEDAAQETFLRVLRHERDLPDVRDAKAWIARVAWRVAVDKARRTPVLALNEEETAMLLEGLPSTGTSMDQSLIDDQMRRLLQQLIATLPDDLRAVITLSTVQEMNASEIAVVLGIPEGSVRTRHMRARQILKEKFAALLNRRSGAI
jgi:RNA polymerase sigma-70 factor, ECF subfamily